LDSQQKDTTKFHIIEKEPISYLFVEKSFALSKKDTALLLCENAIIKGLSIIEEKEFTTKYKIPFINSDDEMEKYAGGRTYGGKVDPFSKIMYIRFTQDEIGPITHEIMHMVAVSAWGFPPNNSFWINEGLATYAANYCSGYTVEELYAFFIYKDMLFSIDSLTTDFFKNNDMIAYHQIAYIVQHLIEIYEIEKLKELWQSGINDFERIYGFTFSKLEADIKEILSDKYATPPSINWDIVGKGCELINRKELIE
jgi:hypothetical protein